MSFVAAAYVAVGAAIEVTTVATVLSAVAAVGTAMTVVGTVTGSKELTKIGAVASVVGGVGGLAYGAFTGLTADAAAGAAGSGATDAATGATGDAASGVIGDTATTGIDAATGQATSSASGAVSGASPNISGTASNAVGPLSSTPPSLPTSSAPFSSTTLGSNASGMYNTPSLTAGAGDASLSTVNTGALAPAGALAPSTPADSMLDTFKNKIGSTWDSLSPQAKAEVAKSLLAIPGGIQNQKNQQAALDIQQQRVNQTSYGSQVPTFGIINKAMKG